MIVDVGRMKRRKDAPDPMSRFNNLDTEYVAGAPPSRRGITVGTCHTCDGEGYVECMACDGLGHVDGWECMLCMGTGKTMCADCQGTGVIS